MLVAHGDRDTYIPFHHGQTLFAAAPEPKTWYAIADADHAQMLQRDRPKLHQQILKFIASTSTLD